MDNRAPSLLPAVRVVEGAPVERPKFLGISIVANIKQVSVVLNPEYQHVDESALPDRSAVACLSPKSQQLVISVPTVESADVTSGMIEPSLTALVVPALPIAHNR